MESRPEPGSRPRTAGSHLRVLVLSTRDIGQRASGRVQVLRTHVDALSLLGHEVAVAVVSPEPPAVSAWTERHRTAHVRAPGLPSVATSALRALLRGDRSLNESLFVDRSVRRRVARLAAELRADLLVVDSLRLVGATDGLGIPAVVDLDDLLSLRYRRLRETAGVDPAAVLGFAAGHVPSAVRGPVARGAVRLLGWEARHVETREQEVSATAAAVSLVSHHEAGLLGRRVGRSVAWLPPAVPIPATPTAQGDGLLFLGGLDYLPNVHALRFFRDEVRPLLDPVDPQHVLHVVGHCPPDVSAEFGVPGIVLHGYADDLHAALARRVMVAPLPGGGVKLKVLDAMAHGLPVIGSPGAFEGLAPSGADRLVAEGGAEMAHLVRELVARPDRARALGLSAREEATRLYSASAAADRWGTLLHDLGLVADPRDERVRPTA